MLAVGYVEEVAECAGCVCVYGPFSPLFHCCTHTNLLWGIISKEKIMASIAMVGAAAQSTVYFIHADTMVGCAVCLCSCYTEIGKLFYSNPGSLDLPPLEQKHLKSANQTLF